MDVKYPPALLCPPQQQQVISSAAPPDDDEEHFLPPCALTYAQTGPAHIREIYCRRSRHRAAIPLDRRDRLRWHKTVLPSCGPRETRLGQRYLLHGRSSAKTVLRSFRRIGRFFSALSQVTRVSRSHLREPIASGVKNSSALRSAT